MPSERFWYTITSKFFLLAALLALLVVGFGIVKSAIRRAEIEREIAALRREIDEHRLKAEQLNKLIEYLGTEEYLEREARLQLGLQKPGENVVIIPASDNSADITAKQPPLSGQELSNWRRWWNYFFYSSHP